MLRDFYVYALLDPRRPGSFIYGDESFPFEPFYIGKGCGLRMRSHYSEQGKTFKARRVSAMRRDGYHPIPVRIKGDLAEPVAFALERQLIELIGRRCDCSGPLTNLTLGGEGISGHKHTPEARAKMRGPKSPQQIANMRAARARTPDRMTPEVRDRIRATLKGRPLPEGVRAKMRGRIPWNKGRSASPEEVERLRGYARSRSEAAAAKRAAALPKVRKSLKGIKLSPERRESMRGWHHTDEAKRKMADAHRGKPRSEEVKAKIRATKALRRKQLLIGHQ